MNKRSPNNCEDCGEDLFQLDGKFFCPSCDSKSGFELVPDKDQFTL
jgi:uncharacterized Zn finger protein (UPF0148 family)